MPLIFGLLGIWITWLLARRVAGDIAGTVAATLAALSPWHIYVSGFARYYSLLYFACGGFYLFAWTAAYWGRRRDSLGALAFALCGSATHPSFLVAVAGPVLGLILIGNDGRFGLRRPGGTVLRLLWVPWVVALGAAAVALKFSGQEGQVRNFSGRGSLATLRLVPAIIQWMTPVVGAAGIIGGVAATAASVSPPLRRWGSMVVAGYVFTPVLLVVASFITDIYADYTIGLLPLAHASCGVLVALAAETAGARARGLSIAALLVLVAGVAPWTVSHLSDGTRFDYRPALELVRNTTPAAPLLAWPEIVARRYAPDLEVRPLHLDPRALESQLLAAAREGFWVIISVREYGTVGDPTFAGTEWLLAHCRRRLVHERMRFDSRRYRVELYRCPPSDKS
jgi:hypothetical protein